MNKIVGSRKVTILSVALLMLASFWLGKISHRAATESSLQNSHAQHTEDKKATIWTCSMHPQIKMPKPGKCPICFMDLIPLSTDNSHEYEGDAVRLSMSDNAKKLAGIVTAPAVRRGMNATIRMTGKIALDETRVEMIAARVGGRIDRLFVDYTGIPVKAGDHLALIYSPELLSLQQELLEAARAKDNSTVDSNSMAYSSMERTFTAAKEKLRLLGFSDSEVTHVLERGTTSDHMTIRAGQTGVVLKKFIEEGSYVKTGMPLFHIADLSKLWVLLDAYESDLLWLRLGQQVAFTVEAYPGQTFTGTVSFIDPVVDPMSRTISVRVEVGNNDLRLKPDMFVKARISASISKSGTVKNVSLRGKWISPMHPQIVKDHPGTCDICGMPLVRAEELGYVTSGFEDIDPLVVPATAILYTGERSLLYVELSDTDKPTFEAREVELGPRVGTYQIIKSGISEGEKVVVNGSFKIDGELQIRAKPSMMSPMEHKSSHTEHSTIVKPLAQIDLPDISTIPISEKFKQDLLLVNNQYFLVYTSLTTDNLEAAKTELTKLREIIQKITTPKGEQYKAWNETSTELLTILEHARHVAELPEARAMFEKVSKSIITLEKQYGHSKLGDYFLAFCPMAFGNKGAYWLQKEKSIRNPYFGQKMLKCGEIKETFSAK